MIKRPIFDLCKLTSLQCCTLKRGDMLVCVTTTSGLYDEVHDAEIDDIALVLESMKLSNYITHACVLHQGVVKTKSYGSHAWARLD